MSVGSRPSVRSIGLWSAFAGVAVALDGAAGGVVAVAIAAVLLAGLPRSVLAVAGTVALGMVPVVVLVNVLPGDDEVSPDFVIGSLWPHHLTFAGFVLVGAWVVLDVAAIARREIGDGDDGVSASEVQAPPGPLSRPLAWLVVAVVSIGAVTASVAVLAA